MTKKLKDDNLNLIIRRYESKESCSICDGIECRNCYLHDYGCNLDNTSEPERYELSITINKKFKIADEETRLEMNELNKRRIANTKMMIKYYENGMLIPLCNGIFCEYCILSITQCTDGTLSRPSNDKMYKLLKASLTNIYTEE
jgi:hypothetical protein